MVDQAEIRRKAIGKVGDRKEAARLLGLAFSKLPDKSQAWQDLRLLMLDYDDDNVRSKALEALGLAFPHIPDKDHAWQYLKRFTQDQDRSVRIRALGVLRLAYPNIPNKDQASQCLQRLTRDSDKSVRWKATEALGSVYPYMIDKDLAWKDLQNLTKDSDKSVRMKAAEALGSTYPYNPERDLAWVELQRLTMDQDSNVRAYANHSLARASIFKAIETEDKNALLKEIKASIDYFEKSSREGVLYNPAEFCLPFYRSYFAIALENAKDDEIKKYLKEAKQAVGKSEGKVKLVEAVENLAKALQESQKIQNKSIEEIVNELNDYRWYCENAAGYMAAAEDKAPGAVKLMRRCNPLLESRIQTTIQEIQEKAKQICQTTRGSNAQLKVFGAEINEAAKIFSTSELVSAQKCSARISSLLKEFCRSIPNDEKRQTICGVVKELEHTIEFPEKLNKIELALAYMLPYLEEQQSSHVDIVILTALPEEYNAVYSHLSDLNQTLDMGSRPNLYSWQLNNIYSQKYNSTYRIALGMTGRAGNCQSALAVREAIDLWKPRYIFFVGTAGGLLDPKKDKLALKKGDVIIADAIYGYEYGKIDGTIEPRGNWTKETDIGLFNSASIYALQSIWREHIKEKPPNDWKPNAIIGEIASGEKIIDDPTNDFFVQVLRRWPKIKAVEMEGAGLGSAIAQAQSLGSQVGFMVIRAISDLPRAIRKGDKNRGTSERDSWKIYASNTAAAFVIGWIISGLPLPPSARN